MPGPKIGIFWYINKDLIAYAETAKETQEQCGLMDFDIGHNTFWPTL